MLNCSSFRALLICALVAVLNTPAWSQSRHIDVKAVDERERPLVDATVMVTLVPEPPKFPGDEMPWSEGTTSVRVFAQTDASGAAKIDVAKLDTLAPNQPMRVTVWKKGYGPQTVTAQSQARVRCAPVLKRYFQIVDSDQRPMVGVKVQQLPTEAVAAEYQAKMVWWNDKDARTNQFGVVALDSHANGSAWFEITASDGVRHQTRLNSTLIDGTASDPRSLTVVRLSRYAKVEGQIPAEFAADYVARLIPIFNFLRWPTDHTTWFDLSIKLQADGRFTIDAVPEGNYWLLVRPKPSSDTAKLFQAGKAPQAAQQIQVVADQTLTVPISRVSLAKVTGRLVTKAAGHDLSVAQVSILQDLPGEPIFLPRRPPFVSVPCSADGSFECWLPPGRYEIGCVASSQWKADGTFSFEVGAGAANISGTQLQVSPTKPVKVAWQSQYRMPTYLNPYNSDSHLVFSFTGEHRVQCNLTQDGYGQILVPVGEEAKGIHQNVRNVTNPRPGSVSAFVDTDPSENYQLELDSKSKGVTSNVGIRGRVVDTLGNAIANVPVSLMLDYRLETQTGMRGLEKVVTESDGSYFIPPRQFLDDVRTSPQGTLKGSFKFSAFVLANPEPVEVQKVISFDSQAWELKEVEFPDLVLEPRMASKRLSVQLLDANGQPAAGEFVQLADQRRLLGAMSDAMGQFVIEDLTGPTWLLRSSDWSVRKIDNYDQPLTIAFDSAANDRNAAALKQRMSKEQRQALARKILEAVPKLDGSNYPIDYPYLPLSDQAYLSPEESFQQVVIAARPGDGQRLQYAKFWNKLGDDKLQRLLAAMETDVARVDLLRLVANRKPSAEAYARVLDAIPMTSQPAYPPFLYRDTILDTILEQIAQVGLKLHHLGRLDPHREKIRQFVAQWKAAQPRPRGDGPQPMTSSERSHSPICVALTDPALFARDTLELLSKDSAELTYEQRNRQSSQAEVFLQLFPNEYEKLSAQPLRIALNQATMISWGEQSPLSALEAYKRNVIVASQLRQVAEASLLSHHADAGPMVREASKLLVRSATPRSNSWEARREIEVYQAARATSNELGRQQAWFMARDYLGGRYDYDPTSSQPTQNQLADRALAVGYCLRDEQPELAEQIVKLGVPRVLRNLERQFEEHYGDNVDMTLAAWFEPQATCDLLIKLSQRFAEESKKQNAQPPAQPGMYYQRLQSMINNLALLRHTCLRGLLLDEL